MLLGMNDNIMHYHLDADKHQTILKKEFVVKDMFKDFKERLLICDEKGAIKMLEVGDLKKDLPYQCKLQITETTTILLSCP